MKIELRERTEEHVRIYFERTRDAQIAAMLPQAAQTVEQAVENYEKTRLPGATSYGRTIYADDAYVGDVWCYCIDPEEEPNAVVSFCLFEKALWRRGIMTEAVKLFLEEAAARFRLESVGAFTYCANLSSRCVLEKSGFRLVETFIEDGVESAYYQKEV